MTDFGPLLIGDRPLPHSIEMERAVVSCLLQDPDTCIDQMNGLSASDFYAPVHRRIFDGIVELQNLGRSIDLINLSNLLDRKGTLEDVGGIMNIRAIANAVPSVANFSEYRDSVLEHGRSRTLISICGSAVGSLFSQETSFDQIFSTMENGISELAATSGSVGQVTYLGDILQASMRATVGMYKKEPQYIGLSTGFQEVNRIIHGIRAGDGGYVVIGARPSIGKTTFALNLAENLCRYGEDGPHFTPGAFISLETGKVTLGQKMIYSNSGVSHTDIMCQSMPFTDVVSRISSASDGLKLPLILDDQGGTLCSLLNRIRVYIKRHNIRFCIIDYIQLIRLMKGLPNREQEIAYISNAIKKLGKDLGCAMIVLAQLNRGAEGRKPALSDLRESGALEQDADLIGLIHRARDTDASGQSIRNTNGAIATDIIWPKNRNGPTGVSHLDFYPESSRFTDHPRIENDQMPI